MNFNFGEVAGVSSASKKVLEGNKIHDVKFDGCEARDIQGVQDPSKVFKVLDIKFSNDEGYFTHTIWEPQDGDDQDQPNSFGGTNPSRVKEMMLLLKHLAVAVAPDLNAKLDKLPGNVTWDQLRKFVAKETESGKGTATKIKLLLNNKGVTTFPTYVAAYNKQGGLYMRTNFIGDKVMFTTKELDRMKKQETAKPTPVEDAPAANTTKVDSDFDFDINAL